MGTGIKKASFFISWYEVAKTMETERALAFYTAIFDYYFYNIEPAEDSPVRESFYLIKPNIDKDVNLKRGGRPRETEKPLNTINNGFNLAQNLLKTDVEVEEEVLKNDVDKEVRSLENSTRFPPRFPQDFHIFETVEDFCREYGIISTTKKLNQIRRRLEEHTLEPQFLAYCWERVREKYPESKDITALFLTAVLSWDNLIEEYGESLKNERVITA